MSTPSAVVWDGPEQASAVTRPQAELGPLRLRIRVSSVGLCGTDLAVWRGSNALVAPGTVMGHEFGGIIEEVGHGAAGWSPGQLVAVDPNLTCRKCESCRSGSRGQCIQRRLMGIHVDGGLQEFIDIEPEQAIPVPQHVDPRSLGLVEPLAVGVHACFRAGIARGMTLGIIGGGPIGMATALEARALGAADIIVIEPDEQRRQTVRSYGFSTENSAHGLHEAWDAVIDAVGIGDTIADALRAVRRGATVCVVGLGKSAALPPMEDLVRRELTITGSFCYTELDLRRAADLVSENGISSLPVDIVSGLQAAPAALQSAATGHLGRGKTLLIP